MVTWFTSDRTVNFSIQFATSSDFVPLAARAATVAWLSVQIMISFTNLFFRQLVTQSRIATTSAWKAVGSCSNEMCHCILLWYLHIPAPVSSWLQAPSVNQTCPFLSHLGQSLYHSFLVGVTVRYLPNVRLRDTWSFIMLNLLSIVSAFTQIRLSPVLSLFGFGLGRRYAAIRAADSNAVPSVGRS